MWDAGELRTPGYKRPSEVEALFLAASRAPVGRENLGEPLSWAIFRASGRRRASAAAASASDATHEPVALILCPAALLETDAEGGGGGARAVYGIRRALEGGLRFLATSGGAGIEAFPEERRLHDLAPEVTPQLPIPVWGVFYRCSAAAAAGRPWSLRARADQRRACEAARVLREALNAQRDGAEATAGMEEWLRATPLPAELAAGISLAPRAPGSSWLPAQPAARREVACTLAVTELQVVEGEALCTAA